MKLKKNPTPKPKKPIPFAFVMDELERLGPVTRPMFGCTAVYVEGKIVLILREKDSYLQDNGVWLATGAEHHASLKKEFPQMRSIELLAGGAPTGWQVLCSELPDFEESVLRACALIHARDPRIGKLPGAKKGRGKPRAKNTGAKR